MSHTDMPNKGELGRLVNRAAILDTIRRKGPVSRVDVKRITGLNFTTVTNAVRDLLDDDLVQEVGLGTSSGGRKPLMLTLNPTGRFAIGCQVQSTQLRVGLCDLEGHIVAKVRESKHPNAPPEEVVSRVTQAVHNLLAETGIPQAKIEGMGVAAPGPLNADDGVLYTPPNMIGWRDVPLKKLLQQRTGLPVLVEKDGNAAALGEAWLGQGQDLENVVFIIVDAGIGAGVIVNGTLYQGSTFGAGEIGHTTVDLDGPPCTCGNHGCLEAIASGKALARRAVRAIRRGVRSSLERFAEPEIGVLELLDAADHGDKLATDLLDEAGRSVGLAVANVINLYNPQMIVLGGRLIEHSQVVLQRAEELGRKRAMAVLSEHVRIVRCSLGDDFLIAGAASLVLTRLFRGQVQHKPIHQPWR